MPLASSWRLPSGIGSADVSPHPVAPLPAEAGQVGVGFQPLGDTSGIFSVAGNFLIPVAVDATVLIDAPLLSLRLSSSGHSGLQRRNGAEVLEESARHYSINLLGEAVARIHHRPGDPTVTLVPVLTLARLRGMIGDSRVPVPIRRFLDGNGGDFSALVRTSPAMHRLLAQFRGNPYDGAMASLYTQGKVCEMLAEAFSDLAGTVTEIGRVTGPDRRRAMTARDLLIADPLNPPAMEALARQVGLSPRRLNEVFRQSFGMTVFEWLVDWRLHQACDLLLEGALPVKEIASGLGYAHVNNFIRAFTRRFGTPPGSWRAINRSVHPFSGIS